MPKKNESGDILTDLVASVVIITIFISLISGLIANANFNIQKTQKQSEAMSYAVQEIEKTKAKGIESYIDKGIEQEYIETDEDIYKDNKFTGYHKKVTIDDYVLVKNDTTKESNILKVVNVEISYKLGGKDNNVNLSTYITK